jgi:hypothetical protein
VQKPIRVVLNYGEPIRLEMGSDLRLQYAVTDSMPGLLKLTALPN